MAVIFDLDQTLIDSAIAEQHRRPGQWHRAYQLIPQLRPYEGIAGLLEELQARHIPTCIVTSSPETYCSRVVNHWGWNFDAMVCYHHTTRRKPFPDPIFLALERLGVEPEQAVSIGDDAKDVTASNRAGVFSIAVLWGCQQRQALLDAQPDLVCETISELRDFLMDRFP